MRTMAIARIRIAEILEARKREGRNAYIAAIDVVLAEDRSTILNYVYFNDESCELVSLDLPAPIDEAAFDRASFERALMEFEQGEATLQ
jgi:hypothetical protein